MNIYENVNKELTAERAYQLGFRDLTTITQGASVYTKGFLKKQKFQKWYIRIEDSSFIYTYYLNSRVQSLKIMEFFETTVKNKKDVFRVLDAACFNKNIQKK